MFCLPGMCYLRVWSYETEFGLAGIKFVIAWDLYDNVWQERWENNYIFYYQCRQLQLMVEV